MEDSKQQDDKSKADRVWDNIVEAFSPIASLFTMRTVFLVVLLAVIGLWIAGETSNYSPCQRLGPSPVLPLRITDGSSWSRK